MNKNTQQTIEQLEFVNHMMDINGISKNEKSNLINFIVNQPYDTSAKMLNFISKLALNTSNDLAQGKPNNQETANAIAVCTSDLSIKSLEFIKKLCDTGLIKDTQTLDSVLTSLSNNVKSINFLPRNDGKFGVTDTENKIVSINPRLQEDKQLLYLYHELAHCCFGNVGEEHKKQSYYYGYMTIEEALAQNIAETCFYYGQQRPSHHLEKDAIFPNNYSCKTNFDTAVNYGLYQPIAVAMGRTLKDIGTSPSTSDEQILFELSQKALKENLFYSIIKEYKQDNVSNDLHLLLNNLAEIYFAKTGVKSNDATINLKRYTTALETLNKLEDYRQVSSATEMNTTHN